jgi:hypothetical protein
MTFKLAIVLMVAVAFGVPAAVIVLLAMILWMIA